MSSHVSVWSTLVLCLSVEKQSDTMGEKTRQQWTKSEELLFFILDQWILQKNERESSNGYLTIP